jgi:SNF2 family DNA or RNA helicase
VLADEMGWAKRCRPSRPCGCCCAAKVRSVLLICPKPLVTNWQREFTLWAPEMPLSIIEGDQAKRRWQWMQPAPVKIANYELLMRDRDVLDEGSAFDLVVLDEAQRIKNRGSTTSQVARSIRRTRNWALTGTPIENSPEDLVGIFEFLSPGLPAQRHEPAGWASWSAITFCAAPRTWCSPTCRPKMFRDAELDLTPEQRATYKLAENEGVMQLNEMGDEITIQHVFELVLRLKQICNFDPATGASSKLERLEADLEEVAASGKKAIVFSQWVKTLEVMREKLRRFGPLEYHGRSLEAARRRARSNSRRTRST